MRSQKKGSQCASDDEFTTPITAAENMKVQKTIINQSPMLEGQEFGQSRFYCEKSPDNPHSSASAPSGILKYGRESAKENTIKPVTIMSLEDRDIVVIDKADIKESTKNESSVIVVDKQRQQREIDLADLLGGNWPSNAGDAALVLNKAMKNQQQHTEHKHSYSSDYSTYKGGSGLDGSTHAQAKLERTKPSKSCNMWTATTRGSERAAQRDNNWTLTTDNDTSAPGTGNSANANISANTSTSNEGAIKNSRTIGSEEAIPSALSPPSSLATCSELLPYGLGVGSMVEISVSEAFEDLYGVIRWIGMPPESNALMVGVELEDDQKDRQLLTTNGSFNGVSLFKCPDGRALFVRPSQCSMDRRFVDVDVSHPSKVICKKPSDTDMFGQVECPSVAGAVSPLKIHNLDELDKICGKFKGIQGHHNSCYLDATLFSMFTFTHVFDSLLFRPSELDDISHYDEVQKVIREEIVNPLRKNVFVRADRVMKLRQLLDKLSSVSGLTSEEKDPEEFLNSLLAQIMRVEPFLKLSSGQDAYFYQLFVEKDERLLFPSVQQLFEQSFHSSDIKLKEVPSCLIIQMPRFGKNFKMYPRILPSQVLDITDIIEDSPRQCSVCGKLAEYECRDCFGILQGGVGLESTAFCRLCLETVHLHAKRANHKPREISVPQDFKIIAEHLTAPRLYMELFAVVCIETSHYVAFVKAGSGPDAPWCFFDSMADRKGEQNGYNIPEMISVPDLPLWLSEDGARSVNETSNNDKMLPEHAKRLFCDAYMCMYQSTDVMMYR